MKLKQFMFLSLLAGCFALASCGNSNNADPNADTHTPANQGPGGDRSDKIDTNSAGSYYDSTAGGDPNSRARNPEKNETHTH